jgi:hypothetical protein
MSKFKSMIALITPEKMPGFIDIIDELLTELETSDPSEYWETINDIHILINGPYFDEECAKYAVSEMVNDDGTTGEHWTLEETTAVAQQNGITFTKFTAYDWYFVLNMVYSDYYSVFGADTSTYIAVAKAWILDKDAPVGKAYKYWEMLKS